MVAKVCRAVPMRRGQRCLVLAPADSSWLQWPHYRAWLGPEAEMVESVGIVSKKGENMPDRQRRRGQKQVENGPAETSVGEEGGKAPGAKAEISLTSGE